MLVGARGAYRLVQPVSSLQVPMTVQAILAARIDRLPAEDKRLLQTAAVVDAEVSLALLQVIADVTEEELHHGLTRLQAAEFLQARAHAQGRLRQCAPGAASGAARAAGRDPRSTLRPPHRAGGPSGPPRHAW